MGHTNDTYEDVERTLSKGVYTVTHLYNAMSGLTARNPGIIGAILNHPLCYAGIIADLQHVHKANIQLASKLKPDHLYLVTDAHAPYGTQIHEFDLIGMHCYARDGKCVDKDGNLVGSMITLG